MLIEKVCVVSEVILVVIVPPYLRIAPHTAVPVIGPVQWNGIEGI